jgi:hypothetical protein
MNNTRSTQIQGVVNKLPITLFFTQRPDRQQALHYLNWLSKNVSETKSINQDKLYREIISKHLRLVAMKMTEIEILFMMALNTITLNDFTVDSKTLITKLMVENKDKNDLDTMYRVMGQIMTKLPKDLKERVNGKNKLDIYQKLSECINMDKQLLEKFISFDPSINTPISMEIDADDYNTLNKKYLDELKEYEDAKGYIHYNSMEYAKLAEEQLEQSENQVDDGKLNTTINAEYIDEKPDFMLGKNDNILYYYDKSSGVLTEMPMNGNQQPVSLTDLKTILSSKKVNKHELEKLVDELNPNQTIETQTIASTDPDMSVEPKGFFDTIGSFFTSFVSNEATITTIPTTTPTIPVPPYYIKKFVNDIPDINNHNNNNNHNHNNNGHNNNSRKKFSKINNVHKRFHKREKLYKTEGFTNENDTKLHSNEQLFLKKIKNDNKHIENTALGFISVVIILFLLVIFNSIRNSNGLKK